MNRAYDTKKPAPVTAHARSSEEELERLVNGAAIHDDEPFPAASAPQPSPARQVVMQYAVPCAIPVGLAAVVYPFMPSAAGAAGVGSGLAAWTGSTVGKFVSGGSRTDGEGEVALLPVADFVDDAAYASGQTAAPIDDDASAAAADDSLSAHAPDAPTGGDTDYAAELAAAEESAQAADEAETAAEVEAEIEELAEELAELEGSSDVDEFVAEAAEEVAEEFGGTVGEEGEWVEGMARMVRRRRVRA